MESVCVHSDEAREPPAETAEVFTQHRFTQSQVEFAHTHTHHTHANEWSPPSSKGAPVSCACLHQV